jgi:hypothetical protein
MRTQSPDQCVTAGIDALVDIDTPGRRAARAAQEEQARLMAVILGPLLACKLIARCHECLGPSDLDRTLWLIPTMGFSSCCLCWYVSWWGSKEQANEALTRLQQSIGPFMCVDMLWQHDLHMFAREV